MASSEKTTELENSVEESAVYTPIQVDEIQSSENVEENVPDEPVKTDLKTILGEDIAMIRGSSREKNIFHKNVTAIRTLHAIEDEQRVAIPEEIEVLRGFAGFGGFFGNMPEEMRKGSHLYGVELYFAQRADLVRAIRLPNTAFKDAGTEVTSAILFFRKLETIRDDEVDAKNLFAECNRIIFTATNAGH